MSADGPFYDEMAVGQRFPVPPAVTIDAAAVAIHRSIAGEHWAPGIDHGLARRLTGDERPLVNPGLVLSTAIGASTIATRRVIANLFYRDVRLRRPVHVGETLRTTTEVRAMADASPKPGTPPRGKAILGIVTTAADDPGDVVLDVERCALIPCRGDTAPGRSDEIGSSDGELDLASHTVGVPDWDLGPLGESDQWEIGASREDPLRDVITSAPELVRLTHNLAGVHRDATRTADGRRLVYGGHPVALAQASLERSIPGLALLVGWHECNHVAPAFEDDLLWFRHTLVGERPLGVGRLRAIRVEASTERNGSEMRLLDWTPVVWTT